MTDSCQIFVEVKTDTTRGNSASGQLHTLSCGEVVYRYVSLLLDISSLRRINKKLFVYQCCAMINKLVKDNIVYMIISEVLYTLNNIIQNNTQRTLSI